jgi:hypothetical protein
MLSLELLKIDVIPGLAREEVTIVASTAEAFLKASLAF